jgi:lipoprotein-releasing system permease protein
VFTEPAGDSIRPRFERFELAGTFEVGAELDYGLVLVGYDTIVKRRLDKAGRAGVRFVMDDPMQLAAARAAVALPPGWQLADWRERYGELFRAVRLEKSLMFLLLLLIVAVAAFNIVSAQTMLVHEKRSDIAILRTMGASSGLIMRTVLMQGVLVAVAGIGAGVIVGLLLAVSVTEVVQAIEGLFGVRLLDGTYFDKVPSKILATDLVVIVALSLSLCVASAAVPARRAASLNPAEALHAE